MVKAFVLYVCIKWRWEQFGSFESVGTRAVLNPSEVSSGVLPGLLDLRRLLCSLVGYVLTMIPVFIPELSRGTVLAALSSSPSSESFMV